jgi:hypothetical protein
VASEAHIHTKALLMVADILSVKHTKYSVLHLTGAGQQLTGDNFVMVTFVLSTLFILAFILDLVKLRTFMDIAGRRACEKRHGNILPQPVYSGPSMNLSTNGLGCTRIGTCTGVILTIGIDCS